VSSFEKFDPLKVENWLFRELRTSLDFIQARVASAKSVDEINASILTVVDHQFPTFLQSLMSKTERVKYDSVIASAREKGATKPFELFQIATAHIIGLAAREKLKANSQNPPLE
jgi:hypothetical protein